jgi:hypothetical protein
MAPSTVDGEGRALDFGAKMRRARERRGLSLAEIAAATKIAPAALEALERNDISRLPGGIFSRAFVRSYAAQVGLDPEATIREFIARFPDASVTAGSPHVPTEDHAAIESQRASASTAVALLAISVPLVAAILYFSRATPSRARVDAPASRGAAPSAAGTGTAAVGRLVLEVFAVAPVRIQIEVDGGPRETLDAVPGERLTFSADGQIVLDVSDAGGVQLTINGEAGVPLGASGTQGTARIDRNNYRTYLASR